MTFEFQVYEDNIVMALKKITSAHYNQRQSYIFR